MCKHENNIKVYTTLIHEEWSESDYKSMLEILPASIQDKVEAEERWEEKYGVLARKLILLYGMIDHGIDVNEIFDHIQRMPSGKPYIVDTPNFSIANDGAAVVCAMSYNSILGIDIERTKPVNLNDFRDDMTYMEWREIYSDMIPLRRFYEFWTIKESVMKAEGDISLRDPKDIFIRPDVAFCNEKYWYIHPLEIDYYGYVSFLVISNPYPEIQTIEVDLLKEFSTQTH